MEKALTGAAGEHFVASQLYRRGYAVGFTARGTRGADLLVTNLVTGKTIIGQVKTMSEAFTKSRKWGDHYKWRVGVSRSVAKPSLFYFLVDFKGDVSSPPDVFVLPSVDLRPPRLLLYPPGSPTPKDAWFDIYPKDEALYKNRWELVEVALA